MIRETKSVLELLGLITQVDETQVPFGGATMLKNVVQYNLGRLQRIPGVTYLGLTLPADASVQVPLLMYAQGVGGSAYSIAVCAGVNGRSVVNLTANWVMTGPTLSHTYGMPWTATYYNMKNIFSGGGNTPQEITTSGTYAAITGTNIPAGNLVQSFFNRLYVSDIAAEEGLVRYTDALTFDFNANNFVNVKEVPGKVTALAVHSPSTDTQGIYTFLLIFKRNAIWAWNETSKDVLTQAIGTESPATIKNTQAGTIFKGLHKNVPSVFLLPSGTPGEPKDIGAFVKTYIKDAGQPAYPATEHAVLDGNFYKLFLSDGTEFWLDVETLATEGKVLWYGPHYRGSVMDASVATPARLEFMRRGLSGSTCWFRENESTAANFLDTDGNILRAVMRLPLNVEPLDAEKSYDLLELRVAKEANVLGNSIISEVLLNGGSQGTLSKSLYDARAGGVSGLGISRVMLPLHAPHVTGGTAQNATIVLTHTMNMRLDIIALTVQYMKHEDKTGRLRS